MKIGITIDLGVSLWSNGLQQNIVALYSLLRRLPSTDCLYVTHQAQVHPLNKKHKGILLKDLMEDSSLKLDILLVCGFDLLPPMYDELKARNPSLKVVLVHYGNKMLDDVHYGIAAGPGKREPLRTPRFLDSIWISPHHERSREYLKTYYRCENIETAPYIWDSFFVEEKIKELQKKNHDPFYQPEGVARVCIFEPNITHLKNCIIPFAICERLEQLHPSLLESINVFCCEKLRGKPYFEKLMNRTSLVKERPTKCYFNNRWGTLTALSKWGSTIVSHQTCNELNYLYFEALYLGIPLIHNSPLLGGVGYYYPDYNVTAGAMQLQNAISNHTADLGSYKGDAQRFCHQYSPYADKNLEGYAALLSRL